MLIKNGEAAIVAEQERYYDALGEYYSEWVASLARPELPPEVLKDWECDSEMVDRRIAEMLDTAGSIAELGCGHSRILSVRPGQTIVHVDSSSRMLASSRKKRGNMCRHYVQARAQALPLKSEAFDLVICVHLLSHLPDVEFKAAVSNACRIIRPGGQLVIADSMAPLPGKAIVKGLTQYRSIPDKGVYRVYKQYRNPPDLLNSLPPGHITVSCGRRFLYSLVWARKDA